MFRGIRLRTKLVLSITTMVVAVVATLSSIYISQLIRQRIEEAAQDGEFVSYEVYQAAREALDNDLANAQIDLRNEENLREATEESLQTDAALNSLLQSVIGYSPVINDVSITDTNRKVIMHTEASLIGKPMPQREDLNSLRNGGFWRQVKEVYGPQKFYEMRLALTRDDKPYITIRVGISTVFLRNEMRSQLNKALGLAGISILLSLLVAAFLSTLALRPLEAISRKLDELSTESSTPPAPSKRKDEFGVVDTKIDRLGQQMRDVKEVFSALKENLDQMMSNLQDGVMLFTREERAVLVSAPIETFLHKSRAELLGKDVHEVFAGRPRLGGIIVEAFERHQAISQAEVLTDPLAGVGGAQRVQLSLDFIEENGERIGALLTLRDAESVHRIENELEISRRLASVGRLTSGVAHEVKNPINAIVVHLELLRQKAKDIDPDTRRHMDVISGEIRRLDRVVQTLVDFTRPVDLRLTETDLRRLLEDVIALSSPDAEKHGVHIIRDVSSEYLPVKVDIDLVKQAVLNVMINGMQAMSANGGDLTVRAHRSDGDAFLEISDQGTGIPDEIREKIFNLYFTTKSGGSGIGLPMTYRVVQLHNGSMEFDSIVGRGTTFRLRFPLVEPTRETLTEVTGVTEGSKLEGR